MPVETSIAVGITWCLTGALANGSFGLLLKFARAWRWEHMWLLFSLSAMLFIPWILGYATINSLSQVLAEADRADLALVFVFGLGWGLGAVLYGISLKLLGLALSYAIVMGLTSALGTLAPLLLLHSDQVFSLRGQVIVFGVVLMVTGVGLSAWAGHLKEQAKSRSGPADPPANGSHVIPSAFAAGLAAALLGGLLSPMLNLSFAYGAPLAELARDKGTSAALSSIVIWVVALSAGFFVNAGYCAYLISRRGSWRLMTTQGFHYGLGLSMGVLWLAGIVFYGVGGTQLGELGAVLGWPLMSSMSIISANFWGLVTGEWAGGGRKALTVMGVSVLVLTAAMFVVGWAGSAG